MRRTRPRAQVSEEVELRAKEYDRQEQRQKGYSRCAIVHVLANAELRQEWLRGQALPPTNRFRRSVYRNSQRIAPRNLLTPTGTMTFSTATASWSLRFTAINLTNKTAVISCLLSAARTSSLRPWPSCSSVVARYIRQSVPSKMRCSAPSSRASGRQATKLYSGRGADNPMQSSAAGRKRNSKVSVREGGQTVARLTENLQERF
jgi:hypothetical protein